MTTSSPLEFGRIVWADIADANGIRKLRPAVVLTSNDRIGPNQPVELIAITSRLPDPLPDDHVLLPWHAQGHPRTGTEPQVCGCLSLVVQSVARRY